jgi:3-oxoadipate enol-lactonase
VTLVLVGALGTTRSMWAPQLAAFPDAIVVELPGHGEAPPPKAEVTVDSMARDVLGAVPGRFVFCGLSLGGMVGMWLGANAAERIERLVLACTGPKLGSRDDYRARAQLVRREGTGVVADGARERWFTPEFRDSPPARRIMEELRGISPEGYAACCEAVGDFDFRRRLDRIEAPTLVVYGRDDPVTTPDVRAELSRFDSVEIPGRHLANLESPAELNRHLA